MAAIYDKALKRKDYSGIINKGKKEEELPSNSDRSKDGKRKEASEFDATILIAFQEKRRTRRKLLVLMIPKLVLMLER